MPSVQPTSTHRSVLELLGEARARTLLIVSPLSNEEMRQRPDPAVDPVLDRLFSIIQFEQRWLLGDHADAELHSYDQWFDLMMDLRQRLLDQVHGPDEAADAHSALDRYRMVVEHEYQQNEAIFETIQCMDQPYRAPAHRELPQGRGLADPGFMARFAGGRVEIGADAGSGTWPAERPRHRVELEPFWIDVMPVTKGDFMTFMASGGYENREVWSEDGWRWLSSSAVRAPGNWSQMHDGGWRSRRLGREAALDLGAPVSHVSYYEAEAFASFVGKRLPSELEWETAAGWDPETQLARTYPWGNMAPTLHVANLDQFSLGPAPVGAFPGNISPLGCYGMIGDVWEWTSSGFGPYPGAASLLSAAPEFDIGARVLRGGSWATRPGAIRNSVRRPAAPGARHLFTGFRCARDA